MRPLGSGDTARPQAAATDAPAAIEATTAARIGERCWGGAVGRTVRTGAWDAPDGIRRLIGGSGMRGTVGWFGASMGGGEEARPMSEERRLIGTLVSERSDATIRRSWSAAARHSAQQMRCLS